MFGGIDPSSGTACMMEIGKALGIKYKQGIPWTVAFLSNPFHKNLYFDISFIHVTLF